MKVSYSFIIILSLAISITCHLKWRESNHHLEYNFEHFKSEFNKKYHSEEEHKIRELIFNHNLQKIRQHNSNPHRKWKAGVNHLTDRIPSELDSLKGYNRDIAFYTHKFSTFKPSKDFLQNLPSEVDWRKEGKVTPVKNQGSCGSCWTFSVTAALESHVAIQKNKSVILSEQQLVDCVQNPHKCGGTGGCSGATQELGFEYVTKNGLALESDYKYFAKQSTCKESKVKPAVKFDSFVKLPENDYNSLLQTLATVGPVAVSVAADQWSFYESGIFDGDGDCGYVINHAVTAVGYGTDKNGNNYWIVRNSWGESWGENGYIRVAREKSAAEVKCGIDKDPSSGSGCEGGPSEIKVCGVCGILSDSSYPVGANIVGDEY